MVFGIRLPVCGVELHWFIDTRRVLGVATYRTLGPGFSRMLTQSRVLQVGCPGWLTGHQPELDCCLISNTMFGSKQRKWLIWTVCLPAFSKLGVKAAEQRQRRLAAATRSKGYFAMWSSRNVRRKILWGRQKTREGPPAFDAFTIYRCGRVRKKFCPDWSSVGTCGGRTTKGSSKPSTLFHPSASLRQSLPSLLSVLIHQSALSPVSGDHLQKSGSGKIDQSTSPLVGLGFGLIFTVVLPSWCTSILANIHRRGPAFLR